MSVKNWDDREFLDGLRELLGLAPLYKERKTSYVDAAQSAGTGLGHYGLNAGCYRIGPAGRWCSGASARRLP
jgi:hypothetical protein